MIHDSKVPPKILALYLLFSLALPGCTQNNKSNQFQEFCSELPILAFPLSLTCGIENDLPQSNLDEHPKYPRYMPRDIVCGRFSQREKYVTILYGSVGDWIYPSLFTFSQDGNPIDSLDVRVYCDGEPGYRGRSFMYFSADQIVTVIDTIATASIDAKHNEIPGTDSLFLIIQRHKINSSGHFEKIENLKKILHP